MFTWHSFNYHYLKHMCLFRSEAEIPKQLHILGKLIHIIVLLFSSIQLQPLCLYNVPSRPVGRSCGIWYSMLPRKIGTWLICGRMDFSKLPAVIIPAPHASPEPCHIPVKRLSLCPLPLMLGGPLYLSGLTEYLESDSMAMNDSKASGSLSFRTWAFGTLSHLFHVHLPWCCCAERAHRNKQTHWGAPKSSKLWLF